MKPRTPATRGTSAEGPACGPGRQRNTAWFQAQTESNNSQEESFAALFEESLKHEDVKEGDIVKGKVIHVGKDHVVVDIGYKSEGTIPLYEFTQADGTVGVKEGDEIDVFLESREDENGLCVLSKEKADRLKVWDEISGACERDELIEGTISARVKGGLSVTIRGGVKAFLPGSQVDLRPVRNLDAFIGKSHRFKVIKFNKKRGNIVLSRRVLLEKERAELKEMTLEKLKEGQIVEGIVKNLTEYGAFIDLGGIDGLLHITDMSWGRVTHPSRAVPGRRPRASQGAQVQRRDRAGLPGPQADQRGSLDPRAGEVPARHRRARQGRLAQGLRRVHRARGGRSRAWSTSPRCPGPVGSSTRRRWSPSATPSRRSCSTSTRARTGSASA